MRQIQVGDTWLTVAKKVAEAVTAIEEQLARIERLVKRIREVQNCPRCGSMNCEVCGEVFDGPEKEL